MSRYNNTSYQSLSNGFFSLGSGGISARRVVLNGKDVAPPSYEKIPVPEPKQPKQPQANDIHIGPSGIFVGGLPVPTPRTSLLGTKLSNGFRVFNRGSVAALPGGDLSRIDSRCFDNENDETDETDENDKCEVSRRTATPEVRSAYGVANGVTYKAFSGAESETPTLANRVGNYFFITGDQIFADGKRVLPNFVDSKGRASYRVGIKTCPKK